MGLVSLSYHGGYAFGVVDRLPSAVGRDDEMVQGGLDVGVEYTTDVVECTSDVFRTLEASDFSGRCRVVEYGVGVGDVL